jgi:hypothetical protein
VSTAAAATRGKRGRITAGGGGLKPAGGGGLLKPPVAWAATGACGMGSAAAKTGVGAGAWVVPKGTRSGRSELVQSVQRMLG